MPKRFSKYKTLISILFMLFALAGGNYADAQKNSLGIDNELFQYYKKIYPFRRDKKILLMADTLYRKSIVKNDVRGQALALNLPCYYYFSVKDEKMMEQATSRVKDFSAKYNVDDVYFTAEVNYINFMLNNCHSYIALDMANKMKKTADKMKSNIGQYTSYEALANIHYQRDEYSLAIKWYSKARQYAENHLPDRRNINAYFRLAECCNIMKKYDEAIDYAQRGIKYTIAPTTQLRNELELCIAYFHLGKKEDFMRLYSTISPNFKLILYGYQRLYYVKIIYNIYKGNYDEAIAIANNIKYDTERNQLLGIIYSHTGDYKEALSCYKKLQSCRLEYNYKLFLRDMADMEKLSGSYLLREKNRQMEIANAKLALANSDLELKNINNKAKSDRIRAEHNALRLKNKQLETQNLKAMIEAKAIEQQKREAAEKRSRMHMNIITSGVGILLVLLAFYLTFRIRMSHKLRSSNMLLATQNDELATARQHAEQSNNMKTMFIQNMSHEIRTPLNAIVGFSQILAECSDDITEEEKHDFSNRIEQSSDLILNIINDILDLSSIESGHYKMQLEPAKANDMCRLALVNVKERVPHGVKLEFTSDVDNEYAIITDSKRVVQVIINFLTNACKNTTEGSIHLYCSSAENDGYLSFIVADTGIGVAPDKMNVIFERFNKLDDLKQGAGLGLSICSIITERLDGLIYIDKNYTHGARFVFAIPLASNS